MIRRAEVIDHLEWVMNPRLTGRLINEVIDAIELAGTGHEAEVLEVGGDRLPAADVVRIYELEEMVARVRAGEPLNHGADIVEGPDGCWRDIELDEWDRKRLGDPR